MQPEKGGLINESNFTPYSCRSPDSTRLTGWLSSCLWVQGGLKFTWNQKAWMQTNYAVGSRMAWKVWQNWTSLMTQPVNSCLAGCDLTTKSKQTRGKECLQNPHQQTWACHHCAPHQNICPDMGQLCVDESFHYVVDDPLVCPSRHHHVWYAEHGGGEDLHGPSVPHASWGSPSTLVRLPIPPESPSQHQSLQSHASTEMAVATHHLKRKGTAITKGKARNINSACKVG